MSACTSALAMRPCCFSCGATELSNLGVLSQYLNGRKGKAALAVCRVDVMKRFLEVGQTMVTNLSMNPSSRFLVIPRALVVGRSSEVGEREKALTFQFRTENGDLVKISVKKRNVKYAVYIEFSSLELDGKYSSLVMSWGIYRSDSACFMPLDSSDSRTIDTPFVQSSINRFVLELEFEAKQTPFYLSFHLKSTSGLSRRASEIRSHRRANFCVPIGIDPGHPAPLGLSYSNDGSMNFAFFSKDADGVILCLYDDTATEKPAMELDLDPYVNRTGNVWHISLEGAWNFVSYSYRCKNSISQGDSWRYLLDPYARVTINWNAHNVSPFFPKYLARLCKEPSFDWSGDIRPNLAMEELVVYRLNVKRFTEDKSSQLYSDVAGTFTGLTEKVNHFKDLGVNAVLLEPISLFDEQKGPYYPCHFYSPTNLYGPSVGSISAITSMKEMVKTLHANGIEVFLEVVFTYTAEHGALRGIDDSCYYYTNRVGDLEARNALNCNYPIVQSLILDSLRHWVTEFHVDGFCFVNSSDLLKGYHGESLSRPPLVESIAFDPLLSMTKIIADCWDPQDMVAKETSFPHWKRWAEMNSKFCYDVRNFLRGEGLLSNLATRLCGSGDIFSSGRGPAFSFNFISRNFGLPLVDLVSFSGSELASECSWNCGEEGPTNKIPVLERRLKQVRNYLFVLYISLGIPVLNMGDECGQSSGGSVSYDNRKPFNWNALSTGFGVQTIEFISFLGSLRRRRSDLLQKRHFLKEENISWHGSDYSPPRWDDPSCRFLAMTLKAKTSVSNSLNGDLFIAFNADGVSESVILPPVPEGTSWHRLIDTALPFPGFVSDGGKPIVEQKTGEIAYKMKSHSCTLFEARSKED